MSTLSHDELNDFAAHYYDRDLLSLAALIEDFLHWRSDDTYKQHYENLIEALEIVVLVLKAKAQQEAK